MIAAAAALWLAPLAVALAARTATSEEGALIPLILVTGGVTLWHELRRRHDRARGRLGRVLALLAVAAAAFALGRLLTLVTLMALGGWLGLIALLYDRYGGAALRRLALPLGYLLFAMPLPYLLAGPLTQALRLWLSSAAIALVGAGGFDVAVSGNALFIDQYELEMAAACTGANSLLSLTATMWLYTYWRRGSDWRRLALIVVLALPIAFVANLLRIVALLLFVHLLGARVLATALHPAAGLASFAIALALVMALDGWLGRERRGG